MERIETDAIIIGGGATGCGITRDCALRGIDCVLVEKHDFAAGTTGRNHGLLHSGARYAVKDETSARECISENIILKTIARHCIEDTGGLFVTLPEDDPDYHEQLLAACRKTGITAKAITPEQALAREPNVNPEITKAIVVPDATIDPFRLASSNILDAVEHGARVKTHCRVTSFITDRDAVTGIRCLERKTGRTVEVHGRVIINASGVWGQEICRLAGIELAMFPSKGSMVILDYRINNVVINRCRKPGDGDILVPGDTVSLIGTTSQKIPYESIDELAVTPEEIKTLLNDGEKMVPNLSRTRVLRAFCGVRPLVATGKDTYGRNITRGIVLVDHKKRDGLDNFISIAGGKLMTYRLMAEQATDLVCQKLGVARKCETHRLPLPGSEKPERPVERRRHFGESIIESTYYRHGTRAKDILAGTGADDNLVCECEMVTAREVAYALNHLNVQDIVDLRRRTRIGMGPCQGLLCAYRCAAAFIDIKGTKGDDATRMLIDFLEERWKGIRPVLWGDTLREAEFAYWVCEGMFGLGRIETTNTSTNEEVIVEKGDE